MVDALSGKVNPSGKLPFTMPVVLEQSPAHALGNFPGHDLKVNYEEGILVGYRWFDTKHIEPQFPFGYGLSYTSFVISDLSTDMEIYSADDIIHLKFIVKNNGSRSGAEVAQVYASDPVCSVPRPEKELKAFSKVYLQPGESKTVSTDIKVSDLAYYDPDMKKWVTEPGDFILKLGTSSRNILQSVTIRVR